MLVEVEAELKILMVVWDEMVVEEKGVMDEDSLVLQEQQILEAEAEAEVIL